jgi:hypothetical protein
MTAQDASLRKRTMQEWIGIGGYMLLLSLIALTVGATLDIYRASPLIWVITLVIIVHLVWNGTGAIAVAMTWVISLIWIAVLITATPYDAPMRIGPHWAMALAGLWLQGILYILLLGFAQSVLAPLRWRRRQTFWLLLGLSWGALGLGAWITP